MFDLSLPKKPFVPFEKIIISYIFLLYNIIKIKIKAANQYKNKYKQ